MIDPATVPVSENLDRARRDVVRRPAVIALGTGVGLLTFALTYVGLREGYFGLDRGDGNIFVQPESSNATKVIATLGGIGVGAISISLAKAVEIRRAAGRACRAMKAPVAEV